jgi:uncharacterized coiled-coil protein SlyX
MLKFMTEKLKREQAHRALTEEQTNKIITNHGSLISNLEKKIQFLEEKLAHSQAEKSPKKKLVMMAKI